MRVKRLAAKAVTAAAFVTAVILCFGQDAAAQYSIPYEYTITGNGAGFTATRFDGNSIASNQPIQDVIDAIKAEAYKPCAIIFGTGMTLDIGDNYITFESDDWGGPVTLRGKLSSTSAFTVISLQKVSVNSWADITNAADGSEYHGAWYGFLVQEEASLTISGGTVSSPVGITTIEMNSAGSLTISGGTVSTTDGIAVNIARDAPVTISGGTVSATTGTAVKVFGSMNPAHSLTISGGTVSATTGIAVSQGPIEALTVISGNALVTSANTGSSEGTITIESGVLSTTGERLVIQGGTVENTANGAGAKTVYNESTGAVTISGGKVLARDGHAVYNASTGAIDLSGNSIVFAYGENVGDVIYGSCMSDIVFPNEEICGPQELSLIIGWNKGAGKTTYTHHDLNVNNDLFVINNPMMSSAPGVTWEVPNRIAYFLNSYTGFIEIEGVTVVTGSGYFTVTFDSQEGSAVDPQAVLAGGKAAEPAEPTLDGYVFGGWFKHKDNECFGFICPQSEKWNFGTDVVTEDITLYARWTSSSSALTSPPAANSYLPTVSVRGRTLNVKLPASLKSSKTADMRIRMIDMRGRTVSNFKISGGINNSFSLTKVPAGRYIIEFRNAGKRISSTPVMIW